MSWASLRGWLTENREERSLKVDVRALDPDYIGGDTDEHAVWSWSYVIEAAEWWIYVDQDDADDYDTSEGPMGSSVTFHGAGRTLDEAAARVIASMTEHKAHA